MTRHDTIIQRFSALVRSVAALLVILATPLSAQAPAKALDLTARQSDFQAFVHDVEDNYAYIDRADKPWLTWQARYAAAVEKAQTKEDFAIVLSDALSELHDFHAEVRSHVPNRYLPVPTFADMWAELRDGQAVLTAVRAHSDAERAGLHAGDRVLRVGDRSTEDAIASRLMMPLASADANARQWALLSVLTGRAEEIRTLTVATGTDAPRRVTLPLERHVDRADGPLSASALPGNIGLIRFNNSLGEQKTVAAFDQALSDLRNTRALVLDLRDMPSGGDSSVALGIMGRFVATMLPYQRHHIPHYGQPDVNRSWLELVTLRGPFRYTAPVVVLVDHWTGSMGEGIAIGFDAMHRATVIGTPMAHLAGAVSDFTLPNSGIDIAFATEQLFHINGTPRQDWLPPILVTEPATATQDTVLARALEELAK